MARSISLETEGVPRSASVEIPTPKLSDIAVDSAKLGITRDTPLLKPATPLGTEAIRDAAHETKKPHDIVTNLLERPAPVSAIQQLHDRHRHDGTEQLVAPNGTRVFSPAGGTVMIAGRDHHRDSLESDGQNLATSTKKKKSGYADLDEILRVYPQLQAYEAQIRQALDQYRKMVETAQSAGPMESQALRNALDHLSDVLNGDLEAILGNKDLSAAEKETYACAVNDAVERIFVSMRRLDPDALFCDGADVAPALEAAYRRDPTFGEIRAIARVFSERHQANLATEIDRRISDPFMRLQARALVREDPVAYEEAKRNESAYKEANRPRERPLTACEQALLLEIANQAEHDCLRHLRHTPEWNGPHRDRDNAIERALDRNPESLRDAYGYFCLTRAYDRAYELIELQEARAEDLRECAGNLIATFEGIVRQRAHNLALGNMAGVAEQDQAMRIFRADHGELLSATSRRWMLIYHERIPTLTIRRIHEFERIDSGERKTLLAQLEAAEPALAQRAFNEMAAIRTQLELADPNLHTAGVGELQRRCDEVLSAGQQQSTEAGPFPAVRANVQTDEWLPLGNLDSRRTEQFNGIRHLERWTGLPYPAVSEAAFHLPAKTPELPPDYAELESKMAALLGDVGPTSSFGQGVDLILREVAASRKLSPVEQAELREYTQRRARELLLEYLEATARSTSVLDRLTRYGEQIDYFVASEEDVRDNCAQLLSDSLDQHFEFFERLRAIRVLDEQTLVANGRGFADLEMELDRLCRVQASRVAELAQAGLTINEEQLGYHPIAQLEHECSLADLAAALFGVRDPRVLTAAHYAQLARVNPAWQAAASRGDFDEISRIRVSAGATIPLGGLSVGLQLQELELKHRAYALEIAAFSTDLPGPVPILDPEHRADIAQMDAVIHKALEDNRSRREFAFFELSLADAQSRARFGRTGGDSAVLDQLGADFASAQSYLDDLKESSHSTELHQQLSRQYNAVRLGAYQELGQRLLEADRARESRAALRIVLESADHLAQDPSVRASHAQMISLRQIEAHALTTIGDSMRRGAEALKLRATANATTIGERDSFSRWSLSAVAWGSSLLPEMILPNSVTALGRMSRALDRGVDEADTNTATQREQARRDVRDLKAEVQLYFDQAREKLREANAWQTEDLRSQADVSPAEYSAARAELERTCSSREIALACQALAARESFSVYYDPRSKMVPYTSAVAQFAQLMGGDLRMEHQFMYMGEQTGALFYSRAKISTDRTLDITPATVEAYQLRFAGLTPENKAAAFAALERMVDHALSMKNESAGEVNRTESWPSKQLIHLPDSLADMRMFDLAQAHVELLRACAIQAGDPALQARAEVSRSRMLFEFRSEAHQAALANLDLAEHHAESIIAGDDYRRQITDITEQIQAAADTAERERLGQRFAEIQARWNERQAIIEEIRSERVSMHGQLAQSGSQKQRTEHLDIVRSLTADYEAQQNRLADEERSGLAELERALARLQPSTLEHDMVSEQIARVERSIGARTDAAAQALLNEAQIQLRAGRSTDAVRTINLASERYGQASTRVADLVGRFHREFGSSNVDAFLRVALSELNSGGLSEGLVILSGAVAGSITGTFILPGVGTGVGFLVGGAVSWVGCKINRTYQGRHRIADAWSSGYTDITVKETALNAACLGIDVMTTVLPVKGVGSFGTRGVRILLGGSDQMVTAGARAMAMQLGVEGLEQVGEREAMLTIRKELARQMVVNGTRIAGNKYVLGATLVIMAAPIADQLYSIETSDMSPAEKAVARALLAADFAPNILFMAAASGMQARLASPRGGRAIEPRTLRQGLNNLNEVDRIRVRETAHQLVQEVVAELAPGHRSRLPMTAAGERPTFEINSVERLRRTATAYMREALQASGRSRDDLVTAFRRTVNQFEEAVHARFPNGESTSATRAVEYLRRMDQWLQDVRLAREARASGSLEGMRAADAQARQSRAELDQLAAAQRRDYFISRYTRILAKVLDESDTIGHSAAMRLAAFLTDLRTRRIPSLATMTRDIGVLIPRYAGAGARWLVTQLGELRDWAIRSAGMGRRFFGEAWQLIRGLDVVAGVREVGSFVVRTAVENIRAVGEFLSYVISSTYSIVRHPVHVLERAGRALAEIARGMGRVSRYSAAIPGKILGLAVDLVQQGRQLVDRMVAAIRDGSTENYRVAKANMVALVEHIQTILRPNSELGMRRAVARRAEPFIRHFERYGMISAAGSPSEIAGNEARRIDSGDDPGFAGAASDSPLPRDPRSPDQMVEIARLEEVEALRAQLADETSRIIEFEEQRQTLLNRERYEEIPGVERDLAGVRERHRALAQKLNDLGAYELPGSEGLTVELPIESAAVRSTADGNASGRVEPDAPLTSEQMDEMLRFVEDNSHNPNLNEAFRRRVADGETMTWREVDELLKLNGISREGGLSDEGGSSQGVSGDRKPIDDGTGTDAGPELGDDWTNSYSRTARESAEEGWHGNDSEGGEVAVKERSRTEVELDEELEVTRSSAAEPKPARPIEPEIEARTQADPVHTLRPFAELEAPLVHPLLEEPVAAETNLLAESLREEDQPRPIQHPHPVQIRPLVGQGEPHPRTYKDLSWGGYGESQSLGYKQEEDSFKKALREKEKPKQQRDDKVRQAKRIWRKGTGFLSAGKQEDVLEGDKEYYEDKVS